MRNLYRPQAIAKAEVGDRMDLPIRIVRVRSWVAFAIGLVVVAGIGSWLVLGTITVEASGEAVLTHGLFAAPAQAVTSMRVDRVSGSAGDAVRAGDVVVMGSTSDGEHVSVAAPVTGTLRSLQAVQPGLVVSEGDVLFVVDRDESITVQALVPVDEGSSITVGMDATISPAAAPAGEYGVIPGTVVYRSDLPVDATQRAVIASATGGALGTPGAPAILVTIAPRLASTPTGFAWTTGDGPSAPLSIGDSATVDVALSRSTPIAVILGTAR